MTRKLALRTERLASLSDDDLRLAAGAGAGEWSGHLQCVLSLHQHCVTSFCTVLNCLDTTAS